MTIVGVTGHQNLPIAAANLVSATLPGLLSRLAASLFMTSLADGADQLCAQIAWKAGIPLSVVIPCRDYESTFDADGLDRFEWLLERSTSVVTLDFEKPSESAFFQAGKTIAERCDVIVAVWDGEAAAGLGGTGDVVAYAKDLHKPATVIWPHGVAR